MCGSSGLAAGAPSLPAVSLPSAALHEKHQPKGSSPQPNMSNLVSTPSPVQIGSGDFCARGQVTDAIRSLVSLCIAAADAFNGTVHRTVLCEHGLWLSHSPGPGTVS